ncbi:MAG: TonB-dependent receptor [Capnocytophaga sp.]|nr:TonB-dependent receptor [Capnocytophaga sp.]
MKNVFLFGATCFSALVFGQQKEAVKDTTSQKVIKLDEVLVSVVRAKETLPVTFSNVSKEEIKKKNFGQQMPILLNTLPNVVSYSEDGSGFGSSNMYVRGADLERINVTINGIPFNDSESHGVFWYNLSDFASSAENIQLQRGVGTSTNGASAFGASLNVLTEAISDTPYAELSNFYGSYNTHKHAVKLSTGKINDRLEISGRFSIIKTDGYRERSAGDMKSYFLQGAYSHGNTLIKGLLFGGKQKVNLATYGISPEQLKENRRYNPMGYYSINGEEKIYDNQTDNYQQDHAQLHWSERWNSFWTTNLAFHYTKGNGYWEWIDPDKTKYTKLGLPSLGTNSKGKEIKAYAAVRDGLDNDFFGTTFSANYKKGNVDFIFGGLANRYEGYHIKTLLWTEKPSTYEYLKEYSNEGPNTKNELSAFAKLSWQVAEKWNLFADLQYRGITYKATKYNVDEKFNFFNPKAGITYLLNEKNNFYLSYGHSAKEPNRSDYKAYTEILRDENPNAKKPVAEELNDFELGYRFSSDRVKINANAFYMAYKNQLVLIGQLSQTGYAMRENSGKSYRAGFELDANIKISDKWTLSPNFSYSKNKNIDYMVTETDASNVTKVNNLGNTNISYSPEIVAGNVLTFNPLERFQISLISKYVGERYMSNANEEDSKLEDFFVNDLSLSYEILPKKVCKSILFSVIGNNIFNRKYVSYGTYQYGLAYIPAAEANFLAGVTLSF